MRVAPAVVWSLSVVLAFGQAVAQEPLARISLHEALQLALRQKPTLRAQQFALESTKAGQITVALRPNPTMNFLAEQCHVDGPVGEHDVRVEPLGSREWPAW
jgi:hypothetical protein